MGGRGGSFQTSRGMAGGIAAQQALAAAQGTVAQSSAAVSGPPDAAAGFAHLTQAQLDDILTRQRAKADAATAAAVQDYIDPRQEPGSRYSMAQNLNHAMQTGYPLTPRQAAMQQGLNRLMTPLGYQTTLYRADHDSFFANLGIQNYQHMSVAQLRSALTGRQWTSTGFESTSHDSRQNPFWPGGYMSGNREVLIRMHTAAGVRGALVQRAQAEYVLAPGTQHRITGVRATRTGSSHTYSGKPVIEIELEVW